MLEYERQERRIATEIRKREMEERIFRAREKERVEKLAAKKDSGRVKRRVIHISNLIDCRKRSHLRMRMTSCWMSIIQKTRQKMSPIERM